MAAHDASPETHSQLCPARSPKALHKMFGSLKLAVRRVLRRRGYELYRRPWLPRGVDPWETFHEIFPAWRPGLIFDVGANVGEVALHLATHFPTAEIHAFEPIGTTAQSLRERVRPCPRIHPHQLALGDSNTRVSAHPQSESTLNSLRDARSPSIDSVPSAETIEVEYDLEYGRDKLQMHTGILKSGARVLVVDDVLATGGTAGACIRLIEAAGGTVVGTSFLVELSFLEGRARLAPHRVESGIIS